MLAWPIWTSQSSGTNLCHSPFGRHCRKYKYPTALRPEMSQQVLGMWDTSDLNGHSNPLQRISSWTLRRFGILVDSWTTTCHALQHIQSCTLMQKRIKDPICTGNLTYNRGFSKWNTGSLLACQKNLNVEMILISEFVTPETRINSTKIVWSDPYFWIDKSRNKNHFYIQVFLTGWQADRLPGFHFEKPLKRYFQMKSSWPG